MTKPGMVFALPKRKESMGAPSRGGAVPRGLSSTNVRGCRAESVVRQRAVEEQSTRQSLGNSASRTARLANRALPRAEAENGTRRTGDGTCHWQTR